MSPRANIAIAIHPPRPRGRPKAADVSELETRLILVARQSFFAHGYGATSIAAIARAARVSKHTLYARFASKAELFRAIMDEQITATGVALNQDGGQRDKSLEAMLRRYAEEMLRASLGGEILQVNRLIYSESARFPELGEAASARMRIGVQQVAAEIRRFAVSEEVPCRDPEAAAEMFILLLRGWYSDVMLMNRNVAGPEIRETVDGFVRLFLAGRASW